jgi:peptidoglycan hydrolase CwlO-like protein
MSPLRIKRALRAVAQLGVFLVAALAAGLLVTGPASASYSSEIAALQQQESALLSQLQSLQGEASSAGQQAAATQQQISAVQQQLTEDQTELSQVTEALAQTKDQLVTTQAQMTKDRTQLADLIVVLYQRGSDDSFAAAIANSSNISTLVDDTVDIQTLRQQFDSLTKQLLTDTDSLKKLQAQQQIQDQQVNVLVDSVQGQENQLVAQENAYSAEQSDLSGQAGVISGQVQQISTQIVLLREEEAATGGGDGSVGQEGLIINICPSSDPGCYTGPYADQDAYPIGQCTGFAASQANVNWLGNADQWIAGDAGTGEYPIGSTPAVNSFVVFDPGGAYNIPYGHVAWVVQVGLGPTGSEFMVEEDNVVGGGREDMRLVPNTEGVMGFIYT